MVRNHMKKIRRLGIFLLVFVSIIIISKDTYAAQVEKDLFYNEMEQDIMISITYEVDDASFRFISPNNEIYDPMNGTDTMAVISNEVSTMVVIKNASQGQWKIRYDKGSNEKLTISVSDYKEPAWIESFLIDDIQDDTLHFSFLTNHTEDKSIQFKVIATTNNTTLNGKELLSSYANTNETVTGQVDISSLNSYDEYYLLLYVYYMEEDYEYFDFAYSEPFSYTNQKVVAGIEDCNISIDPIGGNVGLDWSEYSSWYLDSVLLTVTMDNEIFIQEELKGEVSYSFSYPLDSSSMTIRLVGKEDGILSKELVKTVDFTHQDGSFYIDIPDYLVSNQTSYIVEYHNGDGQQVGVFVNDKQEEWQLQGNGKKQITLENGYSSIQMYYTTPDHITYYYDTSMSVDTYPPTINIIGNMNGVYTDRSSTLIIGTTDPGAKVTINGNEVTVEADGTFSYELGLEKGENTIEILAFDEATNTVAYYGKIIRNNNLIAVDHPLKKYIAFFGSLGVSLLAMILLLVFYGKSKKKNQSENHNKIKKEQKKNDSKES